MARREIIMEAKREEMLNKLIVKFGFESEPTLYFAKWAWQFPRGAEIYFQIAMNWKFWD